VLRAVDGAASAIHEIAEHARFNFEPCDYLAGNGRREPMYRMTPKGLSELGMSFSGDQSRVIRIRFISAFEEVAARLLSTERTITEQLHALERREMPSKLKGQIGSKDFIAEDGDELTTDSLKVAAMHKKRHDNVIAMIRKRVAEAAEVGGWGLLNFKKSHRPNFGETFTEVFGPNGATRQEPAYRISRDGFSLLEWGQRNFALSSYVSEQGKEAAAGREDTKRR
jgi:Rha family phage regulatory protein